MQVQSSTEPPKKLAQGERALAGRRQRIQVFRLQDEGVPIKIVYPAEGTPLAVGNAAVLPGAAPERRQAVLRLPVLARGAAAQQRFRRPALLPSRRQGKGRTHAALRDQAARIPIRRSSSRRSRRSSPTTKSISGPEPIMTSIAQTAPFSRRRGIDLSWPTFVLLALVLSVLVILPLFWLVYYSFRKRYAPRRLHPRQLRRARRRPHPAARLWARHRHGARASASSPA